MFKRKKKKTGCETPEYRCPTPPPTIRSDVATPNDVIWGKSCIIQKPDPPISTIYLGDGAYTLAIGVDKKFNWFQKKMIKWCFGFEVKENK